MRGMRYGSFFDRPPTLVPLTAPPGALGLLTSPDADPGYEALVPSDFNYDTAARIGLLFWSYLPGLRLRRFSRPILILSSSVDRINPPGPTHRHASKCKSATIIELECANLEAVTTGSIARAGTPLCCSALTIPKANSIPDQLDRRGVGVRSRPAQKLRIWRSARKRCRTAREQ